MQTLSQRSSAGTVVGFSPDASWAYRFVARSLDVVVSTAALVVLTPVMLAIALLIRLDSPGPAVFRQVRQGRRRPGVEEERFGRPFTLYKFRSMFTDARECYPELYAYEHTDEELRTLPIKILVSRKCRPEDVSELADGGTGMIDDPRITRVGRFLRRTSLDELPNFLNVLRGDMSLVGPRPDIVENIRYYSEDALGKLDVRPGITGLAQIKGRGTLPFETINEFDLEYVRNRSLRLDLEILWKTIPVLLSREGAA
jgi:lipopolysaccharide/colanic/teichoic acid biosynthesis glycosyltransferase